MCYGCDMFVRRGLCVWRVCYLCGVTVPVWCVCSLGMRVMCVLRRATCECYVCVLVVSCVCSVCVWCVVIM